MLGAQTFLSDILVRHPPILHKSGQECPRSALPAPMLQRLDTGAVVFASLIEPDHKD
jgi:hypothetical protein